MFREARIPGTIAGLVILSILLAACGSPSVKNFGSAEEQFRAAMQEYQKKHYLKAIDGFQKVLYNYSGSSQVDSAQYYLAMTYYLQPDYILAAGEFERLAMNFPGSPFIDNARYMAGLCHFKSAPGHYGLDQEELIKAIEALEDFVTDYPESEMVVDARQTIKAGRERLARKSYESGRAYFRLGYYQSAVVYFQSVIDNYTETPWAAPALYYLGEIALKEKKYEDARAKFDNFLVIYPDHKLGSGAREKLAEINGKLADSAESK